MKKERSATERRPATEALPFLGTGVVAGLLASEPTGPLFHAGAVAAATAFAVAAALFLAASFVAPPSRALRCLGLASLSVALFLLPWVSYIGSALIVAALAGGSCGLAAPRRRVTRWMVALAAGAAVLAVAANETLGALLPSVVGVGLLVLSLLADAVWGEQMRAPAGRVAVLGGGAVIAGLAAMSCVGSTSPTVPWFGVAVVHGPREQAAVALTFDDGPNDIATLEVARILEEHGTRGTFFEVGGAVEQRPEIARALVERGHIVGNHSFTHGQWDYLDPRYPELEETQQAIQQATGVCPAFFRPPHGNRTPLLSWLVGRADMRLVSWDVSAGDWAASDAERLAASVVERARPGSIILLHDGLDGYPTADRSVLVRALPAILDGLAAKGLEVVPLDRLVGGPAYLPAC